jgi:Leucine-rich repeat (LRR) protein
MTIEELHKKLTEAYTVSNLNSISLTLINLFKNRQFSVLQKISEIIRDSVIVKIEDDGKGFSKFMMLYHPDRAGLHINEINKLEEQHNFEGLLGYSHILKLERIEEIASSLNSYEDIDYAPVYEWDMDTDGFTIINDQEQSETVKPEPGSDGYAFYDAIKMREFGDTDIDYPSYYLEDIEEFELASSDINDLDGVQYCTNARAIDVSNNEISDLTPLIGLKNLEELNLSDNQIGYIDALSYLESLRSLLLCNNYIEDVSPLFELENLEYVDLSGNKIDFEQINRLAASGITVDYEN